MSDDDSFISASDTDESVDDDTDAVAMTDINNDFELKEEASEDYLMLSPEDLTRHMNEIIREVSQIINVAPTYVRLLLSRFTWDKDRLIEHFFDHDREQVFRESNLTSPQQRSTQVAQACSSRATTRQQTSKRSAKEPPYCEICYYTKPTAEMTGLGCGHSFCRECWVRYLTEKIMHDSQGEQIACPAHDCGILIDDNLVLTLIQDTRVLKRFQKLITNSFVMCNRMLTWCPGVECNYAARVPQFEVRRIKCRCGEEFCFSCGQPWHDPVICRQLKRWLRKIQDDSETSNWIAVNTKECPKCHVTIEKDGGCNHMVCKNLNCKYEFCWVCLGRWEPHGSAWYNCNRYDEREAQKARDAQELSRAALQRYLFYFNRYVNHSQSLKFEHKLYDLIKRKMEEMQCQGMSWIEVQFLKKAVDVLCMCRRTLMYTYVFAYYLKRNNQSIIFETNQSDLEMATEQLSEYLERDITTDVLSSIKQKVQDKFRYCESRRLVLLNHVHEGYDKDMWEHLENL